MKNKIHLIKLACRIPFEASKVAILYIGNELDHIRSLSQSDPQSVIIDGVSGNIIADKSKHCDQPAQEKHNGAVRQKPEELMLTRAKKLAYQRGIAFLQSQNLDDDLAAEAWAELRDSYFNS